MKDLKIGDIRKDLIEYAMNPQNFKEHLKIKETKTESELEIIIAAELKAQGYNIIQDWRIGSYRIDMVAVFENKKIAIECDGDLNNNGKARRTRYPAPHRWPRRGSSFRRPRPG